MPKKGNKRLAKQGGPEQPSRELLLPSDDQIFGTVTKALGDRHFTVACQDRVERRCKVRGKMHKRQYVQVGHVVIVATRDDSERDKTGDIIHAYTNSEVKDLRRNNHLLMNEIPTIEVADEKVEEVFDWDAI